MNEWLFDETLCVAAGAFFGFLGPHDCSIANEDMMQRWQNKRIQTESV